MELSRLIFMVGVVFFVIVTVMGLLGPESYREPHKVIHGYSVSVAIMVMAIGFKVILSI